MANDIVAGDVGVLLTVTLDDDISDASNIAITLVGPGGVKKSVTAALQGGSDVIVEYTTEADVFSTAGIWEGQVVVTQPSKLRSSSVFEVQVGEAL